MSEPILITGSGIVSSIGMNKEEVLSSLLKKETGIGALKYLKTKHEEFPVGEVKMSDDEMAVLLGIAPDIPKTRTSLMGMLALKEALAEASLTSEDLGSVGMISGTTVGGMDKSELYYLDFLSNDTKNQYISTHDCGACTEMIADYFGDFSFVTTISTACSSAANALILGANMIRSGEVDIVVAGGSECITKFHLNGFNALMILDTSPCRPFDNTRAGLNLGEGAAYIVLESQASAQRRKVKPVAVLSGYGNACDAFHQTASSPDGEGAFRAMSQALHDAGINRENVDYINAHGTGTPNNDLSESVAMKRLFGDGMPPVSSTKSYTGHTTSASGSIEAVICILAMKNWFLPVNLNWKNKMAENGFVPVIHDQPSTPIAHVLCNSFGFGGNNSSLLLSHPDFL
jgi:3-oxoacyl-[acyl-carrier-protein] synthase-1